MTHPWTLRVVPDDCQPFALALNGKGVELLSLDNAQALHADLGLAIAAAAEPNCEQCNGPRIVGGRYCRRGGRWLCPDCAAAVTRRVL